MLQKSSVCTGYFGVFVFSETIAGCVGSFCKKVWNGVKCVAHAVWTGVKVVTKTIVKAIGYVGGIIVEAAATILLVAATVISGVLHAFKLMLVFSALTLLSIVFHFLQR